MINKGYFRSRGNEVEHRGSIRHGKTDAQTAEILRNEGRILLIEDERAQERVKKLQRALEQSSSYVTTRRVPVSALAAQESD